MMENLNSDIKCELCNSKFTNEQTLKVHIKEDHFNIKTFDCESCDKTYSRKTHLKRHFKQIHLNPI